MDEKHQNEEETNEEKEKLDKLNLNINELGEITSNLDMDKINKFLDEHVKDKKLQDEDD